MIDHERRFIFVHVQKTGGTSISAALGHSEQSATKHFSACELHALCGAEVWISYFKFAFVRNPWERLVSWWAMIDRLRPKYREGALFNRFQSSVLARARTFEEFLDNCGDEIVDDDGRKCIYRNQIDYVCDGSGALMVDFVGRFETLSRDFDVIARKLVGKSIALPHVNMSEHLDYVDYYNPASKKKVERKYERDIEAWGYRFGT
jgi:hypothetical protein